MDLFCVEWMRPDRASTLQRKIEMTMLPAGKLAII